MKKSTLTIILAFVVLIILGIFLVWYFLRGSHQTSTTSSTGQGSGFTPFGTTPNGGGKAGTVSTSTDGTTSGNTAGTIPTLRLLSNTPVGGYGASTTASTTFVRWVDRGRGNIYEIHEDTTNTLTLSNTLLPKVYQSVWNKDASSFIGSLFNADESASTVYAALVAQSTSTATSTSESSTPFQLRGKNIPNNVVTYAVSPKGDRIFFFSVQNGRGIGYIAPFDGGTITQIFDTPVTQVNVEWPEENTIAITTKGSASYAGYLYFVSPKTGVWKKILSGVGLSTKVSHDAQYVLTSVPTSDGNISTNIYSVSKNTSMDAIIQTLADKCTWGNFYKNLVYCGVPSRYPQGSYPDDWYTGATSFSDKIWQVNASTGETHLISSITDQSDRIIDAFNLQTDAKDSFLIFMDKIDLSLWSLDLVRSK